MIAYLGRRQAVRHRVLIPAYLGSNPSAPANPLDCKRTSEISKVTSRRILFSGNSNPLLSQKIAEHLNTTVGEALIGQFSDGETRVEIQENVRGHDVFIVQSTCHPTNNHLMELLLMCDAVRRASAMRVTAVVPYFGYARQDKRIRSARVPITAKIIADLFHAVGVHRLLTVDLHAEQIQGFFSIPVDNAYGSKILLEDIIEKRYDNPLIVSPDMGGVVRARSYAKRLNNADLAIIDKRRPKPNEARVLNIIGDVKDRICIIVDDMVDTGGTLSHAALALKEKGAKKIIAYCTHPVLSGNAIETLQNSSIEELVITDTIPLNKDAKACQMIRQLSVSAMLADLIRRISEEQSISAVFD